ncbi:MAG: alpha/beta fold hydrolase [Caldilineaceae bacterium]|nr:alpha/beta fold hydrolase [Caldilineaceae bacterium]
MPTITMKGQAMHYEEQGRGFPILFGHSYLWDAAMWQPQIAALATSYRCIVPELWGHGRSAAAPTIPYATEELAADMWTFTQELGLEQFAVVGLSVGGMWGAHLTLDHPDAVVALVLMDTYLGPEPITTQARYFGMLDVVEQNGGIPAPMLDAIAPLFFSPVTMQQKPEMVERFRADLLAFEAEQIPSIVALGRGIFSRASQLTRLPAINAPTLVIVGADDRSRPPHEAEEMAMRIPGAALEVIADAGHISNLEQPKTVTALLTQFLQTVLPSPPRPVP